MMTNRPEPSKEDCAEAARLYAEAQKLEAAGDNDAAWEAYKASLRLHDDEVVDAAYRKFLSGIGPL